jgi:DNA-binding transcriptional ArsR family regulator
MSRADAIPVSQLRDAVPLFAALGDETRFRLLARLSSHGPASGASLLATTKLTRQATTKHLAVLEEAGLVRSHRDGRDRVWELEPKRLADAQHYLERISKQWDDALDRLRNLVEE